MKSDIPEHPIKFAHNTKMNEEKLRLKRRRAYGNSKRNKSPIQLRAESAILSLIYQCRNLVQADRCALFFVDRENDELWFDVEEEEMRIRIPISSGVAGYCASNAVSLNITDAYKDSRFNNSVDKSTGYLTRSILCVPVVNSENRVLAVIQMINKQKRRQANDTRLGHLSWGHAGEIGTSFRAKPRGEVPCFSSEDEEKLKAFCYNVAEGLELLSTYEKNDSGAPLKKHEVMQLERVLKVLEDEANNIFKQVKHERKTAQGTTRDKSPQRKHSLTSMRLYSQVEELNSLATKLEIAARKTETIAE